MKDKHRLAQKEWIVVCLFLAVFGSLLCIAYLSDVKIDREIERYFDPKPKTNKGLA